MNSPILIIAPRYQPRMLAILTRRFAGVPGVQVVEDRRGPKDRRQTRTMREMDRRRRERRKGPQPTGHRFVGIVWLA